MLTPQNTNILGGSVEELCCELEKLRKSQKSKRAIVSLYEEPVGPPRKKTAYPSITGCTQPRVISPPSSDSSVKEGPSPPIQTIKMMTDKKTTTTSTYFCTRTPPSTRFSCGVSNGNSDVVDLVEDSGDPFFDGLEDEILDDIPLELNVM